MSVMFIYPYKVGSRSVNTLAAALNARKIRLENSRFTGDENKVVLNWGNSNVNEQVSRCKMINPPDRVAIASNKRTFFETVAGEVNVPQSTTDKDTAYGWLTANHTASIVVREKLTGNSGEGIVLLSSNAEWNDYDHSQAKLYVLYIKKRDEYRVHVFGENVVLVQRKAINRDFYGEPDFKIRNHDRGFIFVKNEDREAPEEVKNEAVKAVKVCGLDFGAVDVVWNEYYQRAYVLEINTAPGLEGTTVDTYVSAIQAYANMLTGTVDLQNQEEELEPVEEQAMPHPVPDRPVAYENVVPRLNDGPIERLRRNHPGIAARIRNRGNQNPENFWAEDIDWEG